MFQRQIVINQEHHLLCGHRFSDESVTRDKMVAITAKSDEKSGRDSMAVVEVDGKAFTPQDVS